MNGYAGKILLVDLTSSSLQTLPTQKYVEQYLGGRGIAVRLVYESLGGHSDALHPSNALVFMTGPLTGTLVPSSGRVDVVTRSPETGLLGGANAGGFWGPELKYAGYDGIVVTGKAGRPVYIDIFNDDVEIKDASHLWGKGVYATVATLRRDDEGLQVACIGPAGEKQVNLSGIAFGMRNYASRGGLGAIMGSKDLKAVAVRGTKGLDVAEPDRLPALAEQISARIAKMPSYQEYPQWHYKLFSILEADGKSFFGNYDTSAWPERFEAYERAEQFVKHAEFRPEACFACPLRCWAHIGIQGVGGGSIAACQGTLTSLVNFPKIKDLNKVWKAYLLCQDLGLDTSSTSAVIAYAMDLRGRGVLTDSDTEGLDVRYGNGDALVDLVGRIARREGLGNLLANGVKKASEVLGAEAQRQAVYTKGGLELWLMEIRPFKGTALACAVTDSGSQNRATYGLCEFYYRSMRKQAETAAQHLVGTPEAAVPTEYRHKPKLVAAYENLHILADSMGVCSIPFMPVGLDLWGAAYEMCTGLKITSQDLTTMAARIRTLERLFNVRIGLNREDDTIADRMFQEPLEEGPWKGEVVDRDRFEQMKDEYYSLRGWDREGRPTQETLRRLGLE